MTTPPEQLIQKHIEQGISLCWKGSFVGALKAFDKALAIDPEDTSALAAKASVYQKTSEFSKAIPLYTQVLNKQIQIFGEIHPDVATAYNALGNVYCQIEDFPNALTHLNKGLEIQSKCYPSPIPHPDEARSLSDIGNLHAQTGKFGLALEFLQKALAIQKKCYGPEHQEVLKTTAMIGVTYEQMGDTVNGEKWVQQAFAIQKKLGDAHPEIAAALQGLQGLRDFEEPPAPQQSSGCGACSNPGLFRCSRCRITQYCSKECQRKTWATHKITCRPVAK